MGASIKLGWFLVKRKHHIIFALTFLQFWAIAAHAKCPPGFPAYLPCPKEAYETVQLEHQERLQRLLILSRGKIHPEFYTEYITPSEHGLKAFPVNLPVLRVVFDQRFFFDADSDAIRPEAYSVLDVIAKDLKSEPPDVSLFVAGHTDSTGSDDYNFNLGLRRADVVSNALVRRGVYQSSIYRVSFGEAVPISDNETLDGRSRNRRVEFLFSANSQAIALWLEKQPVETCAAKTEKALLNCKHALHFEARRVMVSPSSLKQVEELSRRQEELEINNNLSSESLLREKQKIELERKKIPVLLSRERVPINLSMH